MIIQDKVSDGMHEMCFSQSNAAIQKQGIISVSRCFGNSQACSVCKAVGIADDEGIERISRVQVSV